MPGQNLFVPCKSDNIKVASYQGGPSNFEKVNSFIPDMTSFVFTIFSSSEAFGAFFEK